MSTPAAVEETRFRGAAAVRLRRDQLDVTFLPDIGMTGVSLRLGGREHLALPGGLRHLRAGGTLGLPLLAPWANRLGGRRYRAAGTTVDLDGLPLHADANGLPIHGLVVGAAGWRVERLAVRGGRPTLRAALELEAPAFPFRHRLELAASLGERSLRVATRLVATGTRAVPVAFGWHPYLQLRGSARRSWRLRLPARDHLLLDGLGLPTGEVGREPAEAEPIARRTFDDLYALRAGRRLSLEADDGAAVELCCGAGYPYAQVWVPAGRPFAALEPMTAPTNALGDGSATLVPPGEAFSATYALVLRPPSG
jgi:aldose 1-epimerase